MADALQAAGVPAARIDLGHVGVFGALADAAGLDSELEGASAAVAASQGYAEPARAVQRY
jgi:ATP phosphoribosyltransferase regulatory subunit HisZ